MNFTIPYRFDETYLPTPRCRKLRHREGRGSIQAEVTALTAAAVHPVFRVTEYDMHKSDFASVMIYQHAGRLWKAALRDNFCCGAPHEPAGADTLQEVFDRYDYHSQHGHLDDQQTEAARAAAYAKDFLLIDGVLHRPCGEPMYNITTFGLGHNHGGTGFFVEYHYNPNIPNRNYFNALHRAEAISYAVQVAQRRGDTDSIPRLQNPQYNIEVFDPSAVRRNPMQDHGKGNPFLNMLDDLCSVSDSPSEAAALVMCATACETKGE